MIAHRVFTHNICGTMGVTNSVFVVVPQGLDPELLLCSLLALGHDEISFGTDDFLVVFDGKPGTHERSLSRLTKPKAFTFLIHDLLSNSALQYIDPGAP